jgi:thiol-disulfide isomerase/thioredoxin
MMTHLYFKRTLAGLLFLAAGSVVAQQPAKKPATTTKTIVKTVPAKPAANNHAGDMHIKPGGVKFLEQPIEKVFELARQQNKPIFVEIYSPSCHVCQSFIPILSNKKVGDFYNQTFVNARLPLEEKSTQIWLEKNKLYVPSLPLFVYFNPDGKIAHVGASNPDVDMVVNLGTVAANPTYQGANYANRYQNGDRDPNFLIDYGYFTKITRDTTTNIRVLEDYVKMQPADFYGSQTSYLVLFKLMMDVDNPLTQHLINNLDMYKKYENAAASLPAPITMADNLIMSSLYSPRGNQYSSEKVKQVRKMMEKIGVNPLLAANRTVIPEINAYFREKTTGNAVARLDSLVEKNKLSIPEYVFIANYFNSKSPDAVDAPSLVRWIDKALSVGKPNPTQQAELQAERAEAFRRSGQKDDAKEAAKKALKLAQTAKADTKRYEELVSKLNSL